MSVPDCPAVNSLTSQLSSQVVSPVFKRVQDHLIRPSMQTETSDIGKSVLRVLECPVCKTYMVPPITFCKGGHNICNNCRPTVSSCPTCKQKFLKTRNASLENLSEQMKFPCRNNTYGCKETFPYDACREHEAICGYSPQKCPHVFLRPTLMCTWNGIAKDLKEHLQTAHKDFCEECSYQHLHLVPSHIVPYYKFKFLFAYNEIFCYHLLIEPGKVHVVLYYIGPAKNDLKYQYKVTVMNKEGTECVVMTHLAIRFTETDKSFPKNCLKLHCDQTECFRDEKGLLPVCLEILRVDG